MARDDEFDLENIDVDEPDGISKLREYAKRQADKAKKVDGLVKEIAFLKAGVDVTSRKGKAFMAVFDGDVNDIEALKADALDFDPSIVVGATASTTTPGADTLGESGQVGTEATQDTGTNLRQALSDGAQPGDAKTDVVAEAMSLARKAIEDGSTEEKAIGGLVNAIANGAANGNIPVILANGQPGFMR